MRALVGLTLILMLLPASAAAAGTSYATRLAPAVRFEALYRDLSASGRDRAVMVGEPLSLTVGLEEGQTDVPFKAASALEVRVDDKTLTLPAGAYVRARLLSGTPAQIEYLPVLATFVPEEEALARHEQQRWQAMGHTVELLYVGAILASDGGVISDNRRIHVAVDRFDSEADAQPFIDMLQRQGERPWLFERVRREASGQMALLDNADHELARGARIAAASGAPITVKDVEFDVGFPSHGHETRAYRGTIGVVFDKTGKLCCVNHVSLEDYLKGVVPSEVPSAYPQEAIKGQAVSARSETIAGLGIKHPGDPYDTCADQRCQVYAGLTNESPSSTAAVQATQGEVLREGARVIPAVYCDCCGGHTENIENVWATRPDPALVGVEDAPPGQLDFPSPLTEDSLRRWLGQRPSAYCETEMGHPQRSFRWQVTLTSARVDALIGAKYPVGHVTDLVPVDRGVSGRLKVLKVVGTKGEALIYKELPIRLTLGGLKSACFVVTPIRQRNGDVTAFGFLGAGWGHGVGMCQVGMQGMAKGGLDYRQILAHYFKAAAIGRVP